MKAKKTVFSKTKVTKIPRADPGAVINYVYLWKSEHEAGLDEGTKARPCAVIYVAEREVSRPSGNVIMKRAAIVPITHTPPAKDVDPARFTALPAKIARLAGLDHRDHWIWVDEVNEFTWPGFDFRPIDKSGEMVFGKMPTAIMEEVVKKMIANVKDKKLKQLPRD